MGKSFDIYSLFLCVVYSTFLLYSLYYFFLIFQREVIQLYIGQAGVQVRKSFNKKNIKGRKKMKITSSQFLSLFLHTHTHTNTCLYLCIKYLPYASVAGRNENLFPIDFLPSFIYHNIYFG